MAVVPRVPLLIVLPLCLLVIAGVWWRGTRGLDFLAPPDHDAIERSRAEVARELARPAQLFALDEPDAPQASARGAPKPLRAPSELLRIDPGDLTEEPPLDAWSDQSDQPVAALIDLASRLETESRFSWALLAWERIIDHGRPGPAEREAALNGIRRLRASVPPLRVNDPLRELKLRIAAPADRLELTEKAAASAGLALGRASSGLILFEPVVRPQARATDPRAMNVAITAAGSDTGPSLEVEAPATPRSLEAALLSAATRLIASRLALEDDLQPIAVPSVETAAGGSPTIRITRLAWRRFAESFGSRDPD